jgi:hypothetical protein
MIQINSLLHQMRRTVRSYYTRISSPPLVLVNIHMHLIGVRITHHLSLACLLFNFSFLSPSTNVPPFSKFLFALKLYLTTSVVGPFWGVTLYLQQLIIRVQIISRILRGGSMIFTHVFDIKHPSIF